MNWTVIRVAFIYLPVLAASLAAAAGYGSYDADRHLHAERYRRSRFG